jgi:hypothetical protein
MSLLVKIALGLCLSAPSMVVFAQTTTCGVPVCSIQETLTQLRAMNADQRGMFAINLKGTHKDSMDQKVLENLYNVGLEMKALSIEFKDEDWILRAASDLVNTAVYNLARTGEVNGQRLARFYGELSTQSFRYNLITHWQAKLSAIEESSVIEELIVFADSARNQSTQLGDEDWVPRAATAFISEATIKLTSLDPAHEGLYNVEVHGAALYVRGLAFDRVAVLDSSSSKNLVIALINTRLKIIVHTFAQAEILGNSISGLSLSNGEMATKFTMTLDRQSGNVSGSLESTKNGVVEFSGTQLASTRSVFAGAVSRVLTQKDVIGTLNGELAGVKGKLTIASFKESVYSATFVSDTGSIVLNFQGKFFPKKGVLGLTSSDKIKLTLSWRNEAWSGFSFSTTTGTASKATFSAVN